MQVVLVTSSVSPSVDDSAIVHPGYDAFGMPPLCSVQLQIKLQVREHSAFQPKLRRAPHRQHCVIVIQQKNEC